MITKDHLTLIVALIFTAVWLPTTIYATLRPAKFQHLFREHIWFKSASKEQLQIFFGFCLLIGTAMLGIFVWQSLQDVLM